uniref:GTF3C1 extended winged-helix domain-containing protein n=2 Tax=Clastoptera arizonana TaxID=38151 RepID=A0A1B6C3M8_9HEMI
MMKKIDKKSLLRIISRLQRSGHVKDIKIQLIGYGKEKTLHFVCQPNISIDHSVIQSNIEQAKLKFITIGKGSIEKLSRRPVKGLTNELLHEGRTRKLPAHLKYNKKAGRSYGFCPKFLRMQILHKFLFYMTYGYTGLEDLNQEEALSKIKEQCDLTEDVSNMMSQIYMPTVDWMMFIPPLPNHGGYGKGWCLLSDVILRLPLLIFLQLVNINYEVPDLYDYLNHPIKKYLLVKNVPLHLKEILTFHRKFVHTIHELITRLCYVGLIQLGSQSFKEKEQVFVYVNTNAILFDTSTSRCGYHQVSKDIDYPVHKYKFKTTDNVEQFWYDCWNFCMHTLLGGRLCATGKVIVLEPLANKPCMIEAVQSRTCNEVTELDVGYIPGDRLGAAGYDSAMFAHLKKNWYWTKPDCLKYPDSNNSVSSIRKKTKEKFVEKRTTQAFDVLQVKPHTSSAMAAKQKYKQKKINVKEMPHLFQKHSKSKKEAAIRILKARKSKSVRKPYYDPVDREALLRMKKLRVDWSPVEDNMLLLCKVTSCVLSPLNSKMLFNNFIVVREILHSAIPESKNKTSRACARRSNYIMKNPQTQLSVGLCLEELKHDQNIKDLYGDFMTKYNDNDSGEKLTPKQKEQIWNETFKELFTMIEARYKRIDDNNFSTLRENFVIPDTISDLLKKFIVTKPAIKVNTSFNEVKSTMDIYYGVINAIIHSSLNTSNDKTSWSYQLFNIYQHYPDKLLRAVMAQTRADQMISFRKAYLRTHQRAGNYLPLSASPYQLSISYVNLLSTRYQFTLYKDCSETLNELKMKWLETDDEHEVLANKGGVTAFLVEFVSMELLNFNLEIPDQVIILDPNFAQKDESYARIVKRYQDILVKLKHQDVTSTVLLDKTFISKCDNDSGESVNESTGENTKLASSQQNVVAKAASHIALYLIREECDGNLQQKELQHAHDFFVVNSTKVFCSLASKEQSGEPTGPQRNELPPSFTPLENSIVEKVLSDIKRRATFTVKFDQISEETEVASTNNISTTLAHELIDFIRNTKEIGASIKDIREKYGMKSEIFELLSTLEEKQVLLRCGVITTRYVYKAFTKPWLVKSYNMKQLERKSLRETTEVEVSIDKLDENEIQKEDSNENHTKNIKLKNNINICIRPWIRINGTINRKTLDRLLSSVLGHIMLVPGCTLQDLQDRFCPALQPYHTRELAEILQTLGCVEMITVCVSHKPSLRSKPSVTTTKKIVGLEKESNIFLEPDPMAIIKLSAFISENSYFQDDTYSEEESFN